MKAVSKYLKDGGVVTVSCGKIPYSNTKRRANEAQVEFGFRILKGNAEPYFTITGGIWNCRHTDYTACGASVHKTVYKYAPSPLLKEMIELGDKYHLTNRSKIPPKDAARIDEIVKNLVKEAA